MYKTVVVVTCVQYTKVTYGAVLYSEEPNYVHVATRTIMCVILEESEEIPSQLMEVLLQNVLNTRKVNCVIHHIYISV